VKYAWQRTLGDSKGSSVDNRLINNGFPLILRNVVLRYKILTKIILTVPIKSVEYVIDAMQHYFWPLVQKLYPVDDSFLGDKHV